MMEYSLLVIKPNRFMDEICKLVEWQMTEYGICIAKKKNMRLTRAQLDEAFTTKADRKEFVRYMNSGDVNVYLVYGDYAVQKLKELKKKIRNMWGTGKSDLNNIVHSSDEGMEYYKQFKVCFPELNIFDYSGYVDFQIRPNSENFVMISKMIPCKVNNVFSIIYNNENKNLVELIADYKYTNCIYGKELEFFFQDIPYKVNCYSKNMLEQEFDDIKAATEYYEKSGGFTALSSFSLEAFDEKFMLYLKENGVKAAFATPAAGSLFLSRNIQEYFEMHDFIALHGGEKEAGIFEIADSKKTFDLLMG